MAIAEVTPGIPRARKCRGDRSKINERIGIGRQSVQAVEAFLGREWMVMIKVVGSVLKVECEQIPVLAR